MKEIDKSIVQRVKDKLGVNTDNLLELWKMLREMRASKHPDGYEDETAKKIAHEEFTTLNNLYEELSGFIEQHQASKMVVFDDANRDMNEFKYIKDIDIKDAEIKKLKQEVSLLNSSIEIEKEENRKLHKTIEELIEKKNETIHNEIKSIYSPKKIWSDVGLVAILTSLIATFPIVRNWLNQIGATSDIALYAIRVFSFVTIFNWFRSFLVNKRVENIEYSILNDSSINERLNIKQRYIECGLRKSFYETDIVSCIKIQLTKFDRILLFGGYEKTIKFLTEDIIIQLNRKKLITSVGSEGLKKVFMVKSA